MSKQNNPYENLSEEELRESLEKDGYDSYIVPGTSFRKAKIFNLDAAKCPDCGNTLIQTGAFGLAWDRPCLMYCVKCKDYYIKKL